MNIRFSLFKTPRCSVCLAGNRATGNISVLPSSRRFLKQIDDQGEQSDKLQSVERSAYQNAILNLRNALVLYQRLKNSVQPEDAQNFAAELAIASKAICPRLDKRRGNARPEKTSTRRSSITWRS